MEVALDDVQFELVDRLGVDASVVEGGVELDELLHHAEQVGAGATSGIDDGDLVEGLTRGAGFGQGDAGGVALIDEAGDGLGVEAGGPFEVALERFAAHEGDDGARGVVGAGLVASGDELLEHLAQHLRVHRHLDIERRGLHDGEVELIEQLPQEGLDGLVGHTGLLVECRLLEEATIEEGHRPDTGVQVAAAEGSLVREVTRLGVVEPGEEEQSEAVLVEVALRLIVLVVLPEGVEVVLVLLVCQPALAGEEVDEHEAVEERLDEEVAVFVALEAGDVLLRRLEDAPVLGEELFGNWLDVEGVLDRCANGAVVLLRVDACELLDGGAARQMALDDHAAQAWPRTLQVG